MAVGYFPPNFVALLLYYYDTNDSYDARDFPCSISCVFVQCKIIYLLNTRESRTQKYAYSIMHNVYFYFVISLYDEVFEIHSSAQNYWNIIINSILWNSLWLLMQYC